jgi:transporter family protein
MDTVKKYSAREKKFASQSKYCNGFNRKKREEGEKDQMWKSYALLAALFASLTAIFAKMGVRDVDSHLATAIRAGFILILTWGIVLFTGAAKGMKELGGSTWLFLFLSAIAAGLSWLFYFKALQLGEVSKVAPIDKLSVAITILLGIILLGEPASMKTLLGGLLITAGSLVLLL